MDTFQILRNLGVLTGIIVALTETDRIMKKIDEIEFEPFKN